MNGNESKIINSGSIDDAYDLAKAYGVANKEVVDFVYAGKGGFKEYEAAMQSASKQTSNFSKILSTAKSIGGNLLSLGANMLASYGASLLVEGAVKGIDYLINYQDKLIEKGNKAKENIEQQTNEFETQKATLGELTAKYESLAKGVRISGNQIKNVRLSEDDYKEFLQVSNDIASTAPSLVKTWDSQGNAILNAGTNISDLNSQVSEYLTLQRDLTHYNTKNNVQTQYKGLLTQQKQLEAEMSGYKQQAEYAQTRIDSLNEIEAAISKGKGVQTFNVDNDTELALRQVLLETGSFVNSMIGDDGTISLTIDTTGLDSTELNGVLGTIQAIRNEANKTISEAETNLKGAQSLNEQNFRDILPSIQTLVDTTSLFDKWDNQELATTFRENLTSMVSNMDMTDISNSIEKSGKNIYDWTIEDIVNPLATASEKQKETWNELFSFEPDENMNVRDIAKARDALLEEVAGFSDSDYWTKSTLAKALGYAYTDAEGKTVWNVQEKLNKAQEAMLSGGEEVREFMKDLPKKDFEIAYSIVASGDQDALKNLDAFEKAFNAAKEEIVSNAELEEFSLSNLQSNVTSAQEALSSYSSAISESQSSTGLTAESIKTLKTQFSSLVEEGGVLEGQDLNSMFINTANGVKINSDAMEKLVDVQHKMDSDKLAEGIRLQKEELKDLTKGTDEYIAAQNELSSMEQAQAQLHAVYQQQKELFSDYAEWQRAQSTENAGDKYTNMVSGLKNAKELFDKGLVGTDDFKSFAKLISPSGAEDWVNFAENYNKAARYLTEDVSGVKNFLNDLGAKGLAEYNSETEQWAINVKDVAEAARQMGMGEEFMTAMFGRLEDYGFHNNVITDVEDGVLKLSEAYSNLAQSEAKLQEMESNPENYSTSAIEEKRKEVEGYKQDIEQLNNNLEYFVENYGDTYNQELESAKNAIEMLNEKRKEILENDTYGENTSAVASQMENQIKQWSDEYGIELDAELNVSGTKQDFQDKLKELQGGEDPVISADIDLDYDKAAMSIEEIDAKIEELNNEKARIEVEANTEKGQSAIEQINKEVSVLQSRKISMKIKTQLDKGASISDLLAMDNKQLATTLDVDTSQVDEARSQLESLQQTTAETTVTVRLDESQFDALTSKEMEVDATVNDSEVQAYKPEEKEGMVEFDKDSSVPDKYKPADKNAKVHYSLGSYPSYNPPDFHRTVYYTVRTVGNAPSADSGLHLHSGTMLSPAHASGTAYNVLNMKPFSAFANGNVTLPRNEKALVNEEEVNGHSESIVRDGKWFLIPGGAHFENLKKGDLIFSAQQTDDLLKHGKIAGHARAYATGTLLPSYNAYAGGNLWGGFGGGLASGGSSGSSGGSSSGGSSSRSPSSPKSPSSTYNGNGGDKESINWIDMKINRIQRKIKQLKNIADNVYRAFSTRNKALVNEISSVTSEIEIQEQAYNRYLAEANSVSLSSGLKKKVRDGAIDINSYDEDTKEKIEDYKKWYEAALDCKDAISDLNVELAELHRQQFDNILTKWTNAVQNLAHEVERRLSLISRRSDYASDYVTRDNKDSASRQNITEYQGLVSNAQKQIAKKASELIELRRKLNEDVANAATTGIYEGSEGYYEMLQEIQDVENEIDELNSDIIGYSNSISEAYMDIFNNIAEGYEEKLELANHLANEYNNSLELAEAKGYLATEQYYEMLRGITSDNIEIMKKEQQELSNSLYNALASGEIQQGSKAWYEMSQQINEVTESIQQAEIEMENFNNSIRETKWEQFDYLQERISKVSDETKFFVDLLSSAQLFDDKGNFTIEGTATLGMHGLNYNTLMSQADDYANELKNVDKELAENPYNTSIIARREELLELQQQAILAAEDEKEAIRSLVEEGIKKELSSLKELINDYKDALDSQKNLYDYQKKVSDQAKNIASLQKQLSAYRNDITEETQAKIQKIKVELESAKEDLEKTQYEKYISDQKKLLDDLYDDYDRVLNERLDNLDLLISDMISYINNNADTINNTLHEISKDVGYTMTETMSSIWGQASDALRTDAEQRVKDVSSILSALVENGSISQQNAQDIIRTLGDGTAQGIQNTLDLLQHMGESGVMSQADVSLLTDALSAPAINALTTYSNDFKAQATTANAALDRIAVYVDGLRKKAEDEAAEAAAKAAAEAAAKKAAEEAAKKTASQNPSNTKPAAGSSTTNTVTDKANAEANKKPSTPATPQKPSKPSKPTSSGNKTLKVGDKVTFASGLYYNSSDGESPLGNQYLGKKVYITSINNASWATKPYHISTGSRLGVGDLGWLTKSQLSYAKGTKRIRNNQFGWTNENWNTKGAETIIRKSDNAILTPLKTDDKIINALASDNMYNFAQNPTEFLQQHLSGIDTLMPPVSSGRKDTQINLGDITFNLPNVTNYEEFKTAFMKEIQTSKVFEKLVQSMTVDQMMKKSRNSKNRFII